MLFNGRKKKNKNLSRPESLRNFRSDFYLSPYHQWIVSTDLLKSRLDEFFNLLDQETLEYFNSQRGLVLLKANGQLSCTLTYPEDHHLVLLFPKLVKYLLGDNPRLGYAILAHEIGHIKCQHQERSINTLQAQLEADRFAFQIGLGVELAEVLEDYEQYEECQIRIEELEKYLGGAREIRQKVLTLQ